VLVTLSLSIAGFVLGRNTYWRESPRRLAAHLGRTLEQVPTEELQAEVSRLGTELGVELAVFDDRGTRLAGTTHAPPPLPQDAVERLRRDPEGSLRRHLGAAAAAGEGRYLRLSLHPGEGEMLRRGLAILLVVVLALAVASAPLARAIARPVERLTEAARRLGEGDLQARSGLERRDEIGELARVFDETAERLERLVAGQRELLANVSHELRTPLARIRVTLGLAAEAEPQRLAALLHEIEKDTLELERLVADVLTAARFDATGLGALHRETLPATRLLERALERFRRLHPDRHVDVSAESPADVFADESLLAGVLDNLMENAAKYSDPATPIALSLRKAEGGIEITLADRGVGMTPEDLSRAFTPFFRADKSRTRDTGGAGLGLALSKRIVEAHAGRITLESLPGRGTTVRVWLPPPGQA
jgi:signal transduction histidine kinase